MTSVVSAEATERIASDLVQLLHQGAPAEELALRASYSEVFRAPSLAELYERPSYVEQFVVDPCGNDPTPTQRANCAADGVPGGAYVQDVWEP